MFMKRQRDVSRSKLNCKSYKTDAREAGLGWAGSGLSSAHFHDLYLPVLVARSAVSLACNSRPTALLSFLCRHGHYSYSSMLACSISDVECYKMWARLPLNHVIVGFSELGGATVPHRYLAAKNEASMVNY